MLTNDSEWVHNRKDEESGKPMSLQFGRMVF